MSNNCHCQKKRLLAHCFDSSKTIISHLFWFKRDVWDNILIQQEALLKIDFKPKPPNFAIFGYFYFKIISKLFQ